MSILVVVQARLGSSRLPGKVLLPAAGRPLLARMLERVRAARTPFDLIVATTTDPADDPVEALCGELGVRCFRGHPTDLLDRHLRAAEAAGQHDAIAKIPSDCPLIDPAAIDRVLSAWHQGLDYLSNLHPQSWPDGNDVEVLSRAALERAFREATAPHEREHTTPYLWDNPDRFRLSNVLWETGLDLSRTSRLVLDYPEDYALIREVYERLWTPARPIFPLSEILSLLEREPALAALNSKYAGVNWYRHHLDALKTVTAADTRTV